MANLTISNEEAKKIYPTAISELKTILEGTFGKAFFSQKITDRVKSFEDACDVLGVYPDCLFDSCDSIDEAAYKKLKVIVKALNEGWTPDWNNSNEGKYYPWFYMNKPGFRLDLVYYNCTASTVGSRLCFRSRELAEYAVNQFHDIYKDFFTM